jgi:hypothetical protein
MSSRPEWTEPPASQPTPIDIMTAAAAQFTKEMEAEVIPAILDEEEKRRVLVAQCRTWQLKV